MRDINTLHPYLREKAEELKQRCLKELGLRVIITECLRTNEEQMALYSQGRDPLARTNELRKRVGWGPISAKQATFTVTKARTASDSWHGYGLAFDVAITDASGKKIDWSENSDWNNNGVNDWAEVGLIGMEIGLEWGGNWTSIYDAPHFQYVFGRILAKVKSDPTVIAGKTIVIPEYDAMLAQRESASLIADAGNDEGTDQA